MSIVLIIALALVLTTETFLLVRAARRLLQFDEIWSRITPILIEYAIDLQSMVKAEGILMDHPEVITFHKRNMNALAAIDSIVRQVTEIKPPKRKVKLPAPDVE